MRKSALLFLCVAVTVAIPSMVWAQGAEYPIIVVPTGKGPYTFPEGYQQLEVVEAEPPTCG